MSFNSPSGTPVPLAPDLLLRLESKKRAVLHGCSELLHRDTIADKTDRRLLGEAMAFAENPTENIVEIVRLSTDNVGMVLAGFDMQGVNAPPEITALQGHFFALQCVARIKFIEDELEKGAVVSPEMRQIMVMATQDAAMLASPYGDDGYMGPVKELKGRLDSL